MGIENKALQIKEATQGERVIDNKIVSNKEEFINSLTFYGVKDLFSDNVKIKRDRERYIIAIDNNNVFAVDGTPTLQNYVQAFYDKRAEEDKREENKKALIRITGLNIEYITGKTKSELDLLKQEMQRQQDAYEASMNIENIKYKLEKNINFYEVEIKDATDKSRLFFAPKGEYTREDKALFKLHLAQMQERLDRLKKMQKETLKIEAGKYADETTNEREKNLTLKDFYEDINEIARDGQDFITQRNDIIEHKGTTTTYYALNIASLSDATRVQNALKKYNDENKMINTVLVNADRKEELSQDLRRLNEYLNKVLSNPNTFDPSKNPFVPTHLEAFNELLRVDPALRRFFGENGTFSTPEGDKKRYDAETGDNGTSNGSSTGVDVSSTTNTDGTKTVPENTSKTTTTSGETLPENTLYTDGMDAFSRGGLYGVIDHYTEAVQGQDPRTQKFYKGFGNALLTVGGVVLGWKVIRNARRLAFGKKEDIEKNNSRARVLGGAGALLATGGRPGEIFRGGEVTQNLSTMLGGIRGGKKNNPKETNPVLDKVNKDASKETKELYGISKVTALFEGRNLGQMRLFVEEDGGKMKLNTEDLKSNIKTLQAALPSTSEADQKKFQTQLEILESLGKDKNNLIDIGLNSLGITYDQIKNGDKNALFSDLAVDPISRIGSIGPYMESKKFTAVAVEDPTKKAALESYIKTGKPALEDLEKQGVFLTEAPST